MNKYLNLFRTVFVILAFASIPMFYNSCSSEHVSGNSSTLSSYSKACDLSLTFEKTWHPFLVKNCSSCHTPSGIGNGSFADSNLATAFSAFQLKGFSKVAKFAVDDSHQSPYSGRHLQSEVDFLTDTYAEKLFYIEDSCGEETITDGTVKIDFSSWLRTKSQPIGLTKIGETTTLTWDLDKDLLNQNISDDFKPTGAKFTISVTTMQSEDNVYYVLRAPTLDMSKATSDLTISGITFRVNGIIVDNETTFLGLKHSRWAQDLRGNTPISKGGMIVRLNSTNPCSVKIEEDPNKTAAENLASVEAQEILCTEYRAKFPFETTGPRDTDVISLQIGSLQSTDLGEQPDGVKVRLLSNNMEVTEAGTYEFTVELTEPIKTSEVSVQIDDTNSGIAKSEDDRMRITNKDGEMIDVKLFDWDYRIIDKAVIFDPGVTTGKFRVYIRPDERHEPGIETFKLQLGYVNGPAEAEDDQEITINIQDDDSPPSAGAVTYSSLMTPPSGVFYAECIKCHNSTDGQLGGYDITDYDNLISDGIVVPKSYATSEMHIRILGGNENLPQMPLNSLMDIDQIKKIRAWIGDGGIAKNGDGSAAYPGEAKND